MRIVPILFRVKRRPDPRLCAKVYTNRRVREVGQRDEGSKKKGPVQIHIGYLPMWDPLSDGQRKKLLGKLQAKWQQLFGNTDVDIDWDDAEVKWDTLRARLGF